MSTVKNTITLTREQAKWFAEVGLSAVSKDDVTPVLCGAHVTVTGAEARVTATDRYRVSTAIVKLEGKAKDHAFLLPREALTWLSKNVGYHGRFMADMQRVVIVTSQPEVGPHTVTISVLMHGAPGAASVAWTGELIKGKFPPVHTLVEKARAAEVGPPAHVRLDWFAKVNIFGGLGIKPLIKFTAADNPDKPGPVCLSWTDYDGKIYAEAIIQPDLRLR